MVAGGGDTRPRRAAQMSAAPVVELRGIVKRFPGLAEPIRAVDPDAPIDLLRR